MVRATTLAVAWMLGMTHAQAQAPSAGELLRDIEHLQVVGSVLYVAAHPDDENTRLISYLVGERGLRTSYLSLTRGGGGQNLIGTEQSELLGVVRTGELLAARGVDGGEQRFTRARDFGYSKSSDESLAFWGRDEVLSDVVYELRAFRPDVVITRFPTEGRTHGHHLASAIVAGEAFEAAADPARFPDGPAPWQADRLLRNQSSWRIDDDTDTSGWLTLEVGGYDPLTGRSWGEVSATSRTMHKSQGFGSAPSVTPQTEYFEALAGSALTPADDLFAGLDLTWSRFEGTKGLIKTLDKAAADFDPRTPWTILPLLAKAHRQMDAVDDRAWVAVKQAELEQVMRDCAGMWLTARTEAPAVSPGQDLAVSLSAQVRAPISADLKAVLLSGQTVAGGVLRQVPWTADLTLPVASDQALSQPHWLTEPPTSAMYAIGEPALRTRADGPGALVTTFRMSLAGIEMDVLVPVEHAWTDRVHGERRHPVEVLPAVTASFAQRGVVLPAGGEARAALTLSAPTGPAKGTLTLTPPVGIDVVPTTVDYDFGADDPDRTVDLVLSAEAGATGGQLTVDALQRTVIDHVHLPRRTVLAPGALTVTAVALDRGGVDRIAYIQGSGDVVPDGLRAVGYAVDELPVDGLSQADLSAYDAVILGIRAYNTHPGLMAANQRLMDYVAAGGRVVMQYNTNSRWSTLKGPIGPAPFQISRLRVTDETAPMVPVDPEHPALHSPNELTEADFDGWVQERGLYFADEWDKAYTPLFAAHDAGEEPIQGGTLVARHGEGVFVYTGLSFFRQLPAGVPGGYRLLANLLAFEFADE